MGPYKEDWEDLQRIQSNGPLDPGCWDQGTDFVGGSILDMIPRSAWVPHSRFFENEGNLGPRPSGPRQWRRVVLHRFVVRCRRRRDPWPGPGMGGGVKLCSGLRRRERRTRFRTLLLLLSSEAKTCLGPSDHLKLSRRAFWVSACELWLP